MDHAFYRRCAQQRDDLLAERQRRDGHLSRIPGKCVMGVVRMLGIRVLNAELPIHIRGEYDPALLEIRVNYAYPETTLSTTVRSTLTIAHELGHHMLHRHELLAGIRRSEQEDEARVWAKIYLLPEQHLRALVDESGGNISAAQFASAFQVSPALMHVRLQEIGLSIVQPLQPKRSTKNPKKRVAG